MGGKLMGVYIKDLEIPTDNTVLIRVFPASENGECYVQQLDVDGDILDELWAVPVQPHGRLIDAEPIMKYITDRLNSGEFGYDQIKVLTEIQYAPTIIPAEPAEEGE